MRTLAAILLLLLTVPVRAGSYVVVVANTSPIQEIPLERVQDIFLKKRRFAEGIKVVPVNILGSEPGRIAFENAVLKMSRDEVQRYWTESHFQGVSPPPTQASFESIKRFVEKVDGAIGYVPREMVDQRVRVLHEF